MNHFNQTKVQLIIGILVILVSLSGFPRGLRTFLLVALGALIVYLSVPSFQKSKEKFNKVAKRVILPRERTFAENKPTHEFEENTVVDVEKNNNEI